MPAVDMVAVMEDTAVTASNTPRPLMLKADTLLFVNAAVGVVTDLSGPPVVAQGAHIIGLVAVVGQVIAGEVIVGEVIGGEASTDIRIMDIPVGV